MSDSLVPTPTVRRWVAGRLPKAVETALLRAQQLPDVRFVAVMPDVPFLCHFERAVGLTGDDPYQEVVRYLAVHRGADERVFETLSYFDGVNMAKRADAAALYSVALMDTICPPSTVYAAFNRHETADKRIEVYTHNGHEGGQAFQFPKQAAFFSTLA